MPREGDIVVNAKYGVGHCKMDIVKHEWVLCVLCCVRFHPGGVYFIFIIFLVVFVCFSAAMNNNHVGALWLW